MNTLLEFSKYKLLKSLYFIAACFIPCSEIYCVSPDDMPLNLTLLQNELTQQVLCRKLANSTNIFFLILSGCFQVMKESRRYSH